MKSKATPSGKFGSRSKTERKGHAPREEERNQQIILENPTPGPMASVGISLTAGQSTEYAREKLEVAAWCTIPCEPNDESIKEAYQIAYDLVTTEVKARTGEAIDALFPDSLGAGNA